MDRTLARVEVNSSADLVQIISDFDPKEVQVYTRIHGVEAEIGGLEIKQDELGIYFVLVPKTQDSDPTEY